MLCCGWAVPLSNVLRLPLVGVIWSFVWPCGEIAGRNAKLVILSFLFEKQKMQNRRCKTNIPLKIPRSRCWERSTRG